MTPEMLADLAAIGPEVRVVAAIVVAIVADLLLGQRGRTLVSLIGLAGVVCLSRRRAE